MALCEIVNKKWQISLLLNILLKYDWKIFLRTNKNNHLMLSNLILLGPLRTTTKNGVCHVQKNLKICDLFSPETQESFPVTKNIT